MRFALVRARADGNERVLRADLVVDVMGRGAHTPAFLEGLGHDRPVEDHLGVRPRPQPVRITNRYVDRVLAAAESDTAVAEQFAKVINFPDPPTRMLRPALIARVATASLRRRQTKHATMESAAMAWQR